MSWIQPAHDWSYPFEVLNEVKHEVNAIQFGYTGLSDAIKSQGNRREENCQCTIRKIGTTGNLCYIKEKMFHSANHSVSFIQFSCEIKFFWRGGNLL